MTVGWFLVAVCAVSFALSAVMAGAWLVWRKSGNSGWVDTIWTVGLGLVGGLGALAPAVASGTIAWRPLLIAALVAAWSSRLAVHIARRTRGITDDPRYAKLQRDWGDDASRQMFALLQKQALVSIPLGLSIVLAAWNPAPVFRLQDALAVVLLLLGVIGEAVADAQLRSFRGGRHGKSAVCDRGLWRWSRHPNYFFEWLGWLAYPLLAIEYGGTYPWGWFALAGPVCMYWLLVHVSGIPPLEAHMLATRGERYRSYQARVSAFFPMPPAGAYRA